MIFTSGRYSQPAAMGASFSPASLSPALWVEARNGVFQSNAGMTVATANSDPVGFITDLSGNAAHMTSAADDTTRPLLQGVGANPYLDFDGVNDVLRLAASLGLYASGSGYSVFMAMRGNPITTSESVVSESSNASNNQISQFVKCGAATASSHVVFQRADDGTTVPANANNTVVQTAVFDNTDRVIGITDSTAAFIAYNNQTAGSTNSYTRSGSLTFNRFALGALVRTTNSGFARMRVHGLVVVKSVLNSTDRANLITYLGGLAGLSI